MNAEKSYAFTVPGEMALPYTYFAGETGSRFLVALRDGKKILGIKDKAGRVLVPPRKHDERTLEPLTEWVEVGPGGTVTGWTVVRYAEPSYQPRTPPYILALIRLDGADVAIPHLVEGIEPAAMKPGLKVRAVFAETRKASVLDIDHFEPA
jgi:uncharacterized OB-fold protein